MIKMLLARESMDNPIHTQGKFYIEGQMFHSIERPWIPTEPGGKSRESCIPAGKYKVEPHTRPDGREALILSNPGLAVYKYPEERDGRYLILIHPGNFVSDVVGCIALGIGWSDHKGGMVTSSQQATRILHSMLDGQDAELQITGTNGYGGKYESA